MEKIKFTVRFLLLLAVLPAVMIIEMTRTDKGMTKPQPNSVEQVSAGPSALFYI